MKKTIISSLVAVLLTAGAYAQQTALDQATDRLQQIMDADRQSGTGPTLVTIELTDPAGNPKQAFNPSRSTNNGAVAQRTTKAAVTGAPKNVGDKVTMPDGTEYVLAEDGKLHLVGEILTDANGNRYIVMDNGKIIPIPGVQQPANPNPNNNTGTATAGVTVVSASPKLEDMYDELSDGRVVAMGPVRVEPAAGGATASTTGGGVPAGLFELDPTKTYYYTDPATGTPTLVEKPLMAMTLKRNQAATNGKEFQLMERGREEHRLDDNAGLSLDPDSEHTPDYRVVAADQSGDMFTSWQSRGGGGFVSTGVVVSGANCAPGYNATALYGNGSCAPIQGGLSVGPHWNRR